MSTPTYDLIASNVLTSVVSSITFSSIPSTYRDLVLVSNAVSSLTNGGISTTVNGDTGPNYLTVLMEGSGGTTTARAQARSSILYSWFTGNITTTHPATHLLHLIDYAQTNKHKVMFLDSNSGTQISFRSHIRYASTSAITSITVATADCVVGSSFHLYGIVG